MAKIIEQYTKKDFQKLRAGIEVPSGIVELGIQTFPGVKFYLNNDSSNLITIGSTGIYNLKAVSGIPITKFTLQNIPQDGDNFYILVDIIKEGVE